MAFRWLLLVLFALPAFAADRPPNVILILADDQGAVDAQGFGADDLYTPNLRALGDRGVRFTQFYVGAPVCSPSRAALMTGRTPIRAGVPGNVGIEAEGMPAGQFTMAEMLKGVGYATAIVGKWHLGEVNGGGPLDQGFDFFFGHKRGCIDNYSHFFYWSGPNNHDLWRNTDETWEDGHYFSDLMLREAKQFISNNRDKPFFIYLPFNMPHYPLQPEEEWRDYYRPAFASKQMAENRFYYAAFVSTLDEKIGDVLRYVERLGLTDNTLIIFLSDHGHSTEERAMFGGGSAGPYRGAKFSMFEGGIRVPSMAALAGVIPEGETRGQFATSMDWLPTLAEITGAKLPANRKIDGKSLMPILKDKNAKTQHQRFFWQLGDQWAVREGDWKLVVNANDTDRSKVKGDEKVFLSNLAEDVSERRNQAGKRPDIVGRLTKLHDAWAAEVGAKR
jgi:arylsulfatase A-like enzyme